jgi:hypothetical protein
MLHLQCLETQTGFSTLEARIHQISDPDESILRAGISQNISQMSFRHTHLFTRIADLTESKYLPFALPDKIDVLEALLATCLLQVGSPLTSGSILHPAGENLILSSKTKT